MSDDLDLLGLSDNDIAVVGMAAHLPGAGDIASYWENLANGVESIRVLSDEELLAAGESPSKMRKSNYVPSAAILDGFADFDADFFGFSPKEAAIMDPQHRQFLEVAWEALENAGHPPENFAGPIGVYAGCGMGSYFYFNICSNPDLVDQTGMFLLRHTGNDKDFLSTRVSHIFDLKGPSINLQTACSTSLVAVHFATQALLNGECDMALAGGVTIELPHARGYLFTEGEILSPDGHCHAFDHRAQGTVFGSGAGCVVLRRAKDAVRDGDHIWAIIKGTAINNDGAAKAGYLAPSVEGQAKCIAEAQAVAGVSAADVSYVECHGTGTFLGDPIEVAALTQAFRETTDAVGSCGIGSVKTNIGHLDTAAGVASLIKVALSLHHRQLPPSLGYEAPNPSIEFDTSPFKVNDQLTDWISSGPRRAGVNSLGVGGTNAHVVLEQAPARVAGEESLWPFQPIVLSAKSKGALECAAQRLAQHLRSNPHDDLADVAYTLKEGRRAFERRRVLVAGSHDEAADLLEGSDPRRVFNHEYLGENPEVVFMFPGGGAQFAGMARDLYETEPVFADWMDQGLKILQPKLDYDIRAFWLPEAGQAEAANELLKRPSVQLPLIMITEYALAQLYISWGVTPAALVGHSMGENTAACLAGVLSFADCIGLVHLRGSLFDTIPSGGMLSVPMAEADLRQYLTGDLDLASVNAQGLCVVSGPDAALDGLAAEMAALEVETQRIAINIAAHSRMLEPILSDFRNYLTKIHLSAPVLPIISNRTGNILTDAEATSPDYWVAHLRNTVNFQACMATLTAVPGRVYMEMGPGRAMSSLAQANGVAQGAVIAALRHPEQNISDDAWHVATIARLWACGVNVDWEPIWGGARRNRVVLPTYSFQRKTYFIEPGKAVIAAENLPTRIDDLAAWGWKPHWKPASSGIDLDSDLNEAEKLNWLIFVDSEGLAGGVVAKLRSSGQNVTTVRSGDSFGRDGDNGYVLAPEQGREHYDLLIKELVSKGQTPNRIGHFWLVTGEERFRAGSSFLHRNMEQGFYSLMFLAQAIGNENLQHPLHITVFTTGAAQVKGEGLPYPEKATTLGPLRVIPKEFANVSLSSFDLQLPVQSKRVKTDKTALTDAVIEELLASPVSQRAALRNGRRFEEVLKKTELGESKFTLAKGAHVLITGGFGGIGLTIAEDLIRHFGAQITLIGRQDLPDRATWSRHLENHDPASSISRRILAVQRLEALGGEVMVVKADVTNLDEMQAAKQKSERMFGNVSVVIHAAGVVDDAPLMTKSVGQVEEVFAPKIHGTYVLDSVFGDGSIELLVLFSSTSTATGPVGQIDYVAANEFMNAYSSSRSGNSTKVIALNWGIWADVGMAADALAQKSGSVTHAAPVPVSQPLLDEMSFEGQGSRIFTASYGIDRWILDGHRTKSGQALLPGTGYIEIAAEALLSTGETPAFELQDMFFFRALPVDEGKPRQVRIRLNKTNDGYDFELQSAVVLNGRVGWQQNAQARIAILSNITKKLDIAEIARRLPEAEIGEGLRSPQEKHLNFGPRWRVVSSRSLNDIEGLAQLQLPEQFEAEAKEYRLHPALLDLATGWAMGLIKGYQPDHLWVPVSYRRISVLRQLPAKIFSWVRLSQTGNQTANTASFDISLAAVDGMICVEIEGFSIHKIAGELEFASPNPRELSFDEVVKNAPISAAEERLLHSFSLGIRPEEGAQVFERAVTFSGSQIYLSSIDLPSLIAQTKGVVTAENDAKGFERPDLDSTYVAPRNDVEQTLVGFWQTLLGVSQVGVEDSFFDLGGHSLIAVRLFAMIKKMYRVEFPISVLFEAPTIARCAELIGDHIGVAGENAVSIASTPARRFTYLVPMHQSGNQTKPPFFLVAGMFGNVLNLRHLAQILGNERPFYGLQAKGLFGDAEPHTTLTQAASDYIAELRLVQPVGPYLLGGFSGGGLTAWEMARQLEEAGEKVSLLVLLDTPLPIMPTPGFADKALVKIADLRKKGPTYLIDWLRNRWAWEMKKRSQSPDLITETQFHDGAIEAAFRAALPKYQMQKRQGQTVLFRPPLDRNWQVTGGQWLSEAKQFVYEDNNLTQFAPDLQVIEVPGDHDSMVLEPNVRVLAAKLRMVIDATEGSAENDVSFSTAAE